MTKRIIGCVLLVAVIAVSILISFRGLSFGEKNVLPEKLGLYTDGAGIRRGLDLDGGSSITYEPRPDEGYKGDISEDLDSVVEVMRARLTNLGYTEANVYKKGEKQLSVEIPGVSNAQEAIDILGHTAKLQFIDSQGNIVLEGSDVVSATAGFYNGGYIIDLEMTDEASGRFSDATERMAKLAATGKNYIAITLDGEELSTPRVEHRIDGNSCIINGLSMSKAQSYAAIISAGRLPFALEAVEYRSIGPTLGEGALENSLLAAAIGLLVIAVLMILIYRLPGFISVISLLFYVSIVALIMAFFQINLSLPGIAGIILSIGMAVDANVVIFERLKEELRLGKSTRAAVKAGFHKAIIAVIDANVTTLIAALVILICGKGTVQGFAVTLLIGVLVSMITAVLVTRYLLNCCVAFGLTSPKLFCSFPKKEKKMFSVSGLKKPLLIFLCCVIVIGAGLSIWSAAVPGSGFGINWGIDFTGGSVMNVSLLRDISSEDLSLIRQTVKDTIGDEKADISVISSAEADTGELGSSQIIMIKTSRSGNEVQKALVSAIAERFELPYLSEGDEKVEADKISWLISSDSVGPTAAGDLTRSAVFSVILASVLMLLYITIRFDFHSGVAAVAALLHDLSIMVIALVLFRVQANTTFIAAVLTILGYSINATIIIFDRIRENKKAGERKTFDEIVDLSVTQTLGRSLLTTVTTLITVIALYWFGVNSIREFAFPILVGLVAGFFSSVFLSGCVWCALIGKRKPTNESEE